MRTEWCGGGPSCLKFQIRDSSSIVADIVSVRSLTTSHYPRVSGIHTLPGSAGASAERSDAPHFSQSSYPMTGGDSPIF